MTWATDFALESRKRMIGLMVAALHKQLTNADLDAIDPAAELFINIHHNFANVDITKLKGDDAEPTVAINPADPDEVFVAVNRFTARRSTDGGKKWSKAGGGVGKTCCDNAASWDEFGNLFLVNLNLLSGPPFVDQAPLYVSTDGGKKFRKLLVLNGDPEVDQPTVKAGAGAVWATWDEAGTIMLWEVGKR